MADKERLGVELYLSDGGFTKGIKQAQQETSKLTQATSSLLPAVVSTEKGLVSATKTVTGVAEAAKKTESELIKLKRAGNGIIIDVDVDDKATSKVKKVKEELRGIKGKVYTATVNVKQNLTGVASGAANKLSGAMFGATAQMAGMAGIGFGIFDAVKGYADFEEEMSAVKAISGATGDEFAKLNEKAIQMGADTKFSALESAQAFKYMGMAGWKTEDMLDGISGVMNLAAASGEDLARVSDIVTDAMTAFGLQAKDAVHFSDVLAAASTNSNTNVSMMGYTFQQVAPLAGALHYRIEDVATAIGVLANQGIKGEKAGTGLKGLLTNLAKPTTDMQEAMDALGLSLIDTQGNVKPLKTLVSELRISFRGLSESQKMNYVASLAGKEGMSALMALVNTSDEDFNKLTKAIENSNGAAEEMSKIRMDNLKGDLEQLSGDWDSFTTKIMGGNIGGFRDIVQGIDNWFAGFAENVEKNGLTVHSILDGITSAIKELVKQTLKMDGLPSILSTAVLAVAGIGLFKGGRKLKGLFGGKKGAKDTGSDLVDDMTINAMSVTLYASQLMPGNGAGMDGPMGRGRSGVPTQGPIIDAPANASKDGKWRGRLGSVGRGLGRGVGAVGRGLLKVGGKVAVPLALGMGAYEVTTSENKGQAGSGLAGSLAGGVAGAKLGAAGGAAIGSIIPGVGTAVGGAIGGLLGGIGGAIFGEQLGKDIYDGITGNLEGIKEWFSSTWQSIADTCMPVINTIVGIFAFAWDWISAKFAPLAQWFDTTVWQPTKEFANTAINAISDFFSGAWETIKGVWNGVAGWFDENVWGPLKAKAGGVFESVGSALGAAEQRGAQVTGYKVPGHATGTNYFGGGWTQINERGGEIVDLPTGSRIYPAATTRKMLAEQFSDGDSGGNSYTVSGNTFIVREEADIDRIAHALFSKIQAAEINYGGV